MQVVRGLPSATSLRRYRLAPAISRVEGRRGPELGPQDTCRGRRRDDGRPTAHTSPEAGGRCTGRLRLSGRLFLPGFPTPRNPRYPHPRRRTSSSSEPDLADQAVAPFAEHLAEDWHGVSELSRTAGLGPESRGDPFIAEGPFAGRAPTGRAMQWPSDGPEGRVVLSGLPSVATNGTEQSQYIVSPGFRTVTSIGPFQRR